jgi:uncharacterized protein (TIGR03067 family)
MTSSLLVGLALAIAAPAPKKADDEVSAKVDGNWVVEKIEGPPGGGPPPGTMRFRFVDGKIYISDSERKREESAAYTVDTTKKPFAMDIRPDGANGDSKLSLAIVEVKGDTLRLCFGKRITERPTEFKGDADKGIVLFIMKREKADK